MKYNKIKKWIVKANSADISQNQQAAEIAAALKLTLPTAQLLINRGYLTANDAENFLAKKTEMLHDPFLLCGMDKAVERIISAIQNHEKITIYGDYDVDGVTSVSILYLYLEKCGADIEYYIPCRSGEGYGMSELAVRRLSERGVKLIVTVDTGITAVSESKLASELGMDVIITDHHECRCDIPEALAVINPRRPDCGYP